VQPQLSVPPQPFGNWPHLPAKSLAQVFAVQVQAPATPVPVLPQTSPVPVQVQSICPPQPSSSPLPHCFE
jgi:hypothetical protein